MAWDNKTLVLRLEVREGSRKWRRNGNDGVILGIKPVPRGSYRGELVISVIDYVVNSDEPPRGVSEGLPEGLDRVLQARLKRRTAGRFESVPGSHTQSLYRH